MKNTHFGTPQTIQDFYGAQWVSMKKIIKHVGTNNKNVPIVPDNNFQNLYDLCMWKVSENCSWENVLDVFFWPRPNDINSYKFCDFFFISGHYWISVLCCWHRLVRCGTASLWQFTQSSATWMRRCILADGFFLFQYFSCGTSCHNSS